jgi:hypothetical protein
MLTEEEKEEYRKQLNELNSSYSVIESIMRVTSHYSVRKHLTETIMSLLTAIQNLKDALK